MEFYHYFNGIFILSVISNRNNNVNKEKELIGKFCRKHFVKTLPKKSHQLSNYCYRISLLHPC